MLQVYIVKVHLDALTWSQPLHPNNLKQIIIATALKSQNGGRSDHSAILQLCKEVKMFTYFSGKKTDPYTNLDDDEKEKVKTILFIMDHFSNSLEANIISVIMYLIICAPFYWRGNV